MSHPVNATLLRIQTLHSASLTLLVAGLMIAPQSMPIPVLIVTGPPGAGEVEGSGAGLGEYVGEGGKAGPTVTSLGATYSTNEDMFGTPGGSGTSPMGSASASDERKSCLSMHAREGHLNTCKDGQNTHACPFAQQLRSL